MCGTYLCKSYLNSDSLLHFAALIISGRWVRRRELTYIPASDLHHCGSGFTAHLAWLLTAKSTSVSGETGNAVCLAQCVYLHVVLRVLFLQRQTAKINWQTLYIPPLWQTFQHLSVSLQEDSWCNPKWKCLWNFKVAFEFVFGFRCSWGNMGNVLVTDSLHYYRLHNVIPLFYETVDLTGPWWKMWSLQGEIALHKHISH